MTKKIFLGLIFILLSFHVFAAYEKCVQIYYDQVPNVKPTYYAGRLNVVFLQNLLGHFPDIGQYIVPIRLYKQGQLDRCKANFYLGSYYDNNNIPQAFIEDFVNAKNNVVWINYNIWKLSAAKLENLWSAKFIGIANLDKSKRNKKTGMPGFYKYFTYKGEIFTKRGLTKNSEDNNREINVLYLKDQAAKDKYVISWAKHSARDIKIPYILRNKNHWYVADMPFSYARENDRYLIFADILFDILNEKPLHHGKRYALVRIEDVHPNTDLRGLRKTIDIFYKYKIPFAISLIPIYADPLKVYKNTPESGYLAMAENKSFLRFLRYAKEHGASFIFHGVTHQYSNKPNPENGVSGNDYEFFDMTTDKPLKEDSPDYILKLLETGFDFAVEGGAKPVAWMAPHYLASALDYVIFGQVFLWNVGQANYEVSRICQPKQLPESLSFDEAGVNKKVNRERRSYFSALKLKTQQPLMLESQFFPYEIYGDYYGQRMIPEDLGYVDMYTNEKQQYLVTKDINNMISNARRNKVLRDAWASFFMHSHLMLIKNMNYAEEIERLIKSFKSMGYQFIDLKTWTKENLREKRLQPIEISPIIPGC